MSDPATVPRITLIVGWIAAVGVAARNIYTAVRELRKLITRVARLEAEIDAVKKQNAAQEERIKSLEALLQDANLHNLALRQKVTDLKHERNKALNQAALARELLRIHNIEPIPELSAAPRETSDHTPQPKASP